MTALLFTLLVGGASILAGLLGALTGSTLGARLLSGAPTRALRLLFGVVVAALAIELLYQGVRGTL